MRHAIFHLFGPNEIWWKKSRSARFVDSLKSWELMGYWWFSCEVVQILVTTMVTDGSYVEGQAESFCCNRCSWHFDDAEMAGQGFLTTLGMNTDMYLELQLDRERRLCRCQNWIVKNWPNLDFVDQDWSPGTDVTDVQCPGLWWMYITLKWPCVHQTRSPRTPFLMPCACNTFYSKFSECSCERMWTIFKHADELSFWDVCWCTPDIWKAVKFV